MIIIKEKRIKEGFAHDQWETIKKGQYALARFMSKNNSIAVMFSRPKVMGAKITINVISATSKMSIDFRNVKDVSSAIDSGNKEPNWEIDLIDGSVLYLDSAI
jgi:hypothetical protein